MTSKRTKYFRHGFHCKKHGKDFNYFLYLLEEIGGHLLVGRIDLLLDSFIKIIAG